MKPQVMRNLVLMASLLASSFALAEGAGCSSCQSYCNDSFTSNQNATWFAQCQNTCQQDYANCQAPTSPPSGPPSDTGTSTGTGMAGLPDGSGTSTGTATSSTMVSTGTGIGPGSVPPNCSQDANGAWVCGNAGGCVITPSGAISCTVSPPPSNTPSGWPDSLLFSFKNGNNECLAYSSQRLGNDVVNPTFINVSYDCNGKSASTSIVGVTTLSTGSISFYFYNSRNFKTCLGSAAFDPSVDAFVGTMTCPNGKVYNIQMGSSNLGVYQTLNTK